jgi:protein-L-isoaspartate(D-aspartate) O-methyltransferase
MTDWDIARANMVESQIRPNAVTDRRLIAALLAVPRERFVPSAARVLAYCDADVIVTDPNEARPPRHLIQPMVFARMVEQAGIGGSDHVLDVGCASGYSSAVIAALAGTVVALEDDDELATRAQDLLSAVGIDNVAVVRGPLNQGYPSQGPYNVIVLEGAVDEVPRALFGQLAPGGRLIAAMPATGMGRVHRYVADGKVVGGVPVFDARLPALPGFQREPGFVF